MQGIVVINALKENHQESAQNKDTRLVNDDVFPEVMRTGYFIGEYNKKAGDGVWIQNNSCSSNVLSLAWFPKSMQNLSSWRQCGLNCWYQEGHGAQMAVTYFVEMHLKTSLEGTLLELFYFTKIQFLSTLTKSQIQTLAPALNEACCGKGQWLECGSIPFPQAERSRSQVWGLSRLKPQKVASGTGSCLTQDT